MSKHAEIYRMVTPKHLCPWGVKSIDLLRRNGFEVVDHHLTTEEANETYKKEHGYSETPQMFLEGKYLGGYDKLRSYLGLSPDPTEGKTYQPVVAVFATTFLMALAAAWLVKGTLLTMLVPESFVSFSMCVLAILKFRDLKAFATGFVQYDLVARHYVPYAYLYALVEGAAGVLMIGRIAIWVAAPAALSVSTIGAISVFKAVYLEKRDLNCACVGGGSSVPLGFISLTENLMMMAMALWMMAQAI